MTTSGATIDDNASIGFQCYGGNYEKSMALAYFDPFMIGYVALVALLLAWVYFNPSTDK